MKKRIGLSYGSVICLFIIAISLIKCKKEEHPNQAEGFINYTLKWDQALKGCKTPETLRYCFYPAEKGAMIQIEGNSEGVYFKLPPDKYRLLIFNCDAENIQFRKMDSYETAEAFIPETKAANSVIQGKTPLYGVTVDNLEVEAGEGKSNKLEFTPVPLVREISLNIKVGGIEHIEACTGALSGAPASFSLSKHVIIPEKTTTVNFETTSSAEGVKASIMILGTAPKAGEDPPPISTHEVKLDFTLTDGSSTSATIDLGESIGNTEGPSINVDVSVTVKKDITFSVKINSWEVSAGDSMVIE